MTPLAMVRKILRDEGGGAIVENTITMWVFILLTFGIVQVGMIMWSAVGIQHGVQMAARCASVSDAAIDAGLTPATTPTPCYSTNTKGAWNNESTVQSYAASNSWGVGVPSSSFYTPPVSSCASNANTVSAPNYSIILMNFLVTMRFAPQSCYDTVL